MKKTIAILFFLLLSLQVFPQSSTDYDNWIYEGDKTITEYKIPDGVKKIGKHAFSGCKKLKKIIFPYSVIEIGAYACDSCYNLQTITIENGVQIIGKGAFYLCTNLQSVTIPESVEEIHGGAFSSCYRLQKFVVDKNNKHFSTLDGVLFNYDKTKLISCPNREQYDIPQSTEIIEKYAFQGCKLLKSVTIPNSVKVIDNYALSLCDSLTSIIIPESISSMGKYVFWGCKNLKEVTIANGLTKIEEGTFMECENLTSITIPESVTSIGESAFEYCKSLKSVFIPKNVKEIKDCAFGSCYQLQEYVVDKDNMFFSTIDGVLFNYDKTKLICGLNRKEYNIPQGTKIIGKYAFQGCNALKSLTMPNSVEVIEAYGCSICPNLKSITIPSSVKSIGLCAFWQCKKLTSVVLSENLNSIGTGAFFDCANLVSISIPGSVKKIGVRAFEGCTSLQSVTMEAGVQEIGDYAFESCNSLEHIIMTVGISKIGKNAFPDYENRLLYNADATELLRVPQSVKEFTIPKSVIIISKGAFSGCANLESITIPGNVKQIADSAFGGCENLKSVIIENGITEIKHYAFSNCIKLESITIPESVKEISRFAFLECNNLLLYNADSTELLHFALNNKEISNHSKTDESVTISGSVKRIGAFAFGNNNIKSVILEDGVEEIGRGAFYDCPNLESVTVPGSVKRIGAFAFDGCTNLKSVTIENGVEYISNSMFNNCNSLESITIPGSVKVIDFWAFSGCKNLKSVTIGNGVERISGFDNCTSLESIIIPGSVKEIGCDAFVGCTNLKSVTIENGVEEIDWYAFKNCTNLESIIIPGSVKEIGDNAFEGCTNLKSVTIENGVEEIKTDAFKNCTNLESIIIPGSVKSFDKSLSEYFNLLLYNADSTVLLCVPQSIKELSIPKSVSRIVTYAFKGCTSIESVTIPGNVKEIGSDAFVGCTNLKSITIENGVEEISDAFRNCTSLESIILPGSVKKIGDNAFEGCTNLKSVTIENGVEEISVAFNNCTSLASITIPESVKKIDYYAFVGCKNLKSVVIGNNVSDIGFNPFKYCRNLDSESLKRFGLSVLPNSKSRFWFNSDSTILISFVKDDSLDVAEKITIPGYVKKINNGVFYECKNLSVMIENGVEEIGAYAFRKSAIDTIIIPGSVKKIGRLAFHECENLKSVTIKKGVEEIGYEAFGKCTSLESITIPSSVKKIGESAFSGCTNLKSVTIENGVEEIERSAFSSCTSLESITIPGSVKKIGRVAFRRCSNLESITIPGTVKKIGNGAFMSCKNIKSVTIENGVEEIGRGAFYDCPNLESVTVPGSVKSIGEQAFPYPTLAKCATDTSTITNMLVYKCMMDYYKSLELMNMMQDCYLKIVSLLKPNQISRFSNFGLYQSIADYYSSIGDFESMLRYSQEGYDMIMKMYETRVKSGVVDSLQTYDFIFYSSLLLLQTADAYLNLKQFDKANEILLERYPCYNYLKGYGITDTLRPYETKLQYHLRWDKYSWIYYSDLLVKGSYLQNNKNFFDDIGKILEFYIERGLGIGTDHNFNIAYGYRCTLNRVDTYDVDSMDDYFIGYCWDLYDYCRKYKYYWESKIFSDFDDNHPVVISFLGDRYYKLHEWTNAYRYYKKSFIYEFDKLQRNFSFMNSYQRNTYWQKHQLSFDNIVKICTRLFNKESICMAYNSLLVSKGLLLSSEQSLSSAILNSKDQKLIEDFYKLKQYRLQMDTITSQQSKDSLRILAEQLESSLMQRSAQNADITNYMKVDWQMVKNSLGKKDCAIEFFFNDADSLYALILKRDFDSPKLISLCDFAKIKETYYSNTDVYNAVWKPLEQYFSTDGKVYFSPSGQLYNIAIEYAPIDDKRTISDKYKIYRISSTRNLALAQPKNPNKKAAVYGGIVYDIEKLNWQELLDADNQAYLAELSAFRDVPILYNNADLRSGAAYLKGTELEAKAIIPILRNNGYQVSEHSDWYATEESFKKLSGSGIKILHIGTHGFYQPSDTAATGITKEDISLSQSGLLLAGANASLDPEKRKNIPEGADDGILTAKEISRLDFKGLDLVVLSACQTGLGEVTSEGVFGLQRGFKKAGAQTIVMSLWSVEDRATQLLMTEFFKNLTSGKTKREAFLSAQNTVKEKYHDPMYWAAFVMVDGEE